jgi:hypothetical protein
VNAENIKKFTFLANCQMGTNSIQKQKKHGKPRVVFIKDSIPEDKESDKYLLMIDFLKQFDISHLENMRKICEVFQKLLSFQTTTRL